MNLSARRGSFTNTCKAVSVVQAGEELACNVVYLSTLPDNLNSYLALISVKLRNIFPLPFFQFPFEIHFSMSLKVFAMHLFAVFMFPRFAPWFLLDGSTNSKNGSKATSGSFALPVN